MEKTSCLQTYPWELDEDFKAANNEVENEHIKTNILKSIGIPKPEGIKTEESDGESTESDSIFYSEHKYNVLRDPDCGYACEKDVGWFDLVMSKAPWDESRRPYEKILKYEDLVLTGEEKEGILTGMVMSTGLNLLDLIPLKDDFALTKLQLSNKGLTNIQILDVYKYLQYLDISYNSIQDLSPLEQSTYLIVLDASHNNITRFVPNPTPWFLTHLNLSHNNFKEVPDVSNMWSLKHLNLSNNSIQKIEGIRNLKYLHYLNFSNNQITTIENISDVPLRTLDLSWNEIDSCTDGQGKLEGLKNISTLQRLDLSHNKIKSMSDINCINSSNLRHLNIAFNNFDSVTSFDDLDTFKTLRYLRLEGNQLIHELPEIVNKIMHMLPQLSYINGTKLSKKERLGVYSMWNEDPIIHEMKNYCYHLLYNNVEPPEIGVESRMHLNYDVPIVILVGPCGSKKHSITKYIANKHFNYVRIPALHTTMQSFTPQDNICDEFRAMSLYHLEENEFRQMWTRGKFVTVQNENGDLFGLSREELEDDGRLCLLPLNIGSALSLTWQGLNTTMILIRPRDEDDYSDLLQRYVSSKLLLQRKKAALQEITAISNKPVSKMDIEHSSCSDECNVGTQANTVSNLNLAAKLRNLPSNTFEADKDRSALKSSDNVCSPRQSRTSLRSLSSPEEMLDTMKKNDDILNQDTLRKDEEFVSIEYKMDEELLPWWCEEESEEELPEVNSTLEKPVAFIDELKVSNLERKHLWCLYTMYYNEKKAYYEDVHQHLFTQSVVVDYYKTAEKKILPILIEKYNARIKKTTNLMHEEKDDLFEVLVQPRLNEMMEILADRGGIEKFDETKDEYHANEIDSSEPSKDTLSVPFYSPATSSLNVTPSTSLTEFGSMERHLEEPDHFWAPMAPPTPPSTSSSVLETIAKESMKKEGFRLNDEKKTIKYYKES